MGSPLGPIRADTSSLPLKNKLDKVIFMLGMLMIISLFARIRIEQNNLKFFSIAHQYITFTLKEEYFNKVFRSKYTVYQIYSP